MSHSSSRRVAGPSLLSNVLNVAFCVVSATIILVAAMAGAESQEPEEFDFMALYERYANARIKGDLGTFRMLTSREEVERIEESYHSRGIELTGDAIRPKREVILTRYFEFPVIQRKVVDDVARLVLWNDIDVEGSQYEIVCILFRREYGYWRVVVHGSVMLDKRQLTRDGEFPEDELPGIYRFEHYEQG